MSFDVPPRGGRFAGDRGSALVEAAFVTPLLMFLLLGVFENSYTFLDYLTSANASRAGVRMAAIAGNDASADYQIVQAILTNSTAMQRGDLNMIVIYEAAGSTSLVPAGCAAGTSSTTTGGHCNVYQSTDFNALLGSTTYGCGVVAKDRYWCPTTRKTSLQGANGPPGWIGIYVVTTHRYLTTLFGTTVTLRNDAVTRFEPDSLQ
jgi:Flp pilus assembly protein TadG